MSDEGTSYRCAEDTLHPSIQGLHPLKDPAFEVFEGESFRVNLDG